MPTGRWAVAARDLAGGGVYATAESYKPTVAVAFVTITGMPFGAALGFTCIGASTPSAAHAG